MLFYHADFAVLYLPPIRRISSIDYSKEKGSAVIHFEKPSAAKTALMVSLDDNHTAAQLISSLS
jgi:hypothetical protein